MKKTVFILFVVMLFRLNSAEYNAKVQVDYSKNRTIEKKELLFGNFFEFLNDFINGENGLWAQEIYDRGFDDNSDNQFLSKWIKGSEKPDCIKLLSGGYNENGLFYVNMNSDKDGIASIDQSIYLDAKIASEFYIYLKNNTSESSKFKLRIVSTISQETLFEQNIELNNSQWKKYSISIPALIKSNRVRIELCLDGVGDIDIDEVSLMPTNNVKGVRKEFYDMFKKWSPGIIRYPGGYFADMKIAHFEYAIGAIDKRKSPLKSWEGHYQRMDFGVNEFIQFCKSIDAEPHLVVNLVNGTEQEAANWVQYCNSSKDTDYGKKRLADGFAEPYNVKYWEIGNEQWSDTTWMLPRFVQYYDAMHQIDPNIKSIIDGDVWQGYSYFNSCMKYTKDKCNNYGWHYATFGLPKDDNYYQNERFKIVMGSADVALEQIKRIGGWLINDNYFPTTKQSITEHILVYRIQPGWIDTNNMNASLEAGLFETGLLINLLNNSQTFELYEKTFGLNHIRIRYNSAGERVIYPTVIHNVISFMRNNCGDIAIPTENNSPKYNTELYDGMFQLYDIPNINSSLTMDSTYYYLYLLNKSPDEIATVELDSNLISRISKAKVFELSSNSFLDFNSADNPNKIDFREIDVPNKQVIEIKPFSARLYKFPVQINDSGVVQDISIRLLTNDGSLKYVIQLLDNQMAEIELYSLLGQKVFTDNNIMVKNYQLDLSNTNSGVYILKVKQGSNTKVFKIII